MKRSVERWAGLILLPLLLNLPLLAGHAAAPPTGPIVYAVQLSPGYYEYFPIRAFANVTTVQYSTVTNASISTAFMTASQFRDFAISYGLISDSIAHENGTRVNGTVKVAPGSYDILVYASGGAANGSLEMSISPNNPFVFGPISSPEPSGIASFGIINQSGADNPYEVASTDVVGFATISRLQALNSSADSLGVNPSGVTLQLNSMLVVDEGPGGSQVYWCQNTPDFVTSTSQISPSDNIWNASVSGVLTNSSITSQGGSVNSVNQNGTTLYYYALGTSNSTYSLPMGLVLLINATAVPGSGVLVQFGIKATGGVLGTAGTDWFDNATIHDPAVRAAYFATDGNYSTPNGMFYDTELVFGGEGNGESTHFTSMAASLGLFYANGTNGQLSPFQSYFSFGLDTKEAADDLAVSYMGNGEANVTVGTPNYVYLGAASGSFSASDIESGLGFPAFTGGGPTTTSTSATSSTSALSSTSTSSSTSSNGIPEFPFQALWAAMLVALTVVSYLAVRHGVMDKVKRKIIG